MKKRFLSLLLLICITATAVFGLAGCDETGKDDPPSPEKLSAPVVVLTDDTATWDADHNADKFEISKNGKLSFVENTYVSEKLTDGDTFKVRAVGDGTKYETSDWSNTVTYTATTTHECDFTGEWKSDETHHWHECSCGLTDTKVAHSGGTATETEKAKCSVCNAPYGELLTPPAHECDFTGEWKSDETHHWHECSCGLTDTKVAHSGGTATETEKAKCSVCNAPYGELLTPPAHECDFTGEWKSDETHHWHECSCGLTDTKVAHSGGTATETEKAKCSVCNAPYGELLPGETVISNVSISDFNTNFDTYVSSLEVVEVTGIIYAGDNGGLYITDDSGDTLYVYCNHTGLGLSVGQEVTFTGTAKLYYSLPEFYATSITVSSNIPGVDITVYNVTIEQIINANASQAEKVFAHKVYRTAGMLTKDGSYYYLVDGENKLQLKTSTFAEDYNDLIAFEGKRIRVDIVLSDCFSNTGIFRVSPLTGDNANVIEVNENNVPIVSIAAFNSNFDAYATSLEVVEVTGIIYAGDNGGLYITDDSGDTLYVYCNHTGLGLSIGEEVTFTGTAKLYYSLPEFYATSITVSSSIPGVDITVYAGTIAQIINANASQAEKVFDHNVYRATGVLTKDGSYYYLVDGDSKLQIKSSTFADDYNNLITYVDKKISVNIVISDCFSTTGIFRVSPLVGADADIEEVEETGGETPDTPEITTPTDINFVMINDTHGAFTDSDAGYSIGRVDSLVEALEANKGDYIFIHNGDAFQGSYVSGETYGLALLEALNASGVDCFVIGNHEFDWGIDKIAAYADGNTQNGEANFPFLGANIFYKGTTTRPDWIDAYAIFEQDGVKVGVIGIMGDDQESSILTRYVKDYDFVDPIDIIEETAAYLRTTAGCGVVVVATHDYTPDTNTAIAALSGNSRIDAIFCAHTHQNISETVTRSDYVSIPVVQCNHKNVNAQEVIITLSANGDYDSFSANKYYPAYYDISDDVQTVINKYQYLIDEASEVIGSTPTEISKGTLGSYAVDAMMNNSYSGYDFGGVDIAIINTGGVRATINSGEITRAEIFEVFPFNNAVVLVNMSGKLLKELYGNNKNYFYMDIADSIGNYTSLSDDTIYQLAVIDYVFENTFYDKQFSQITANNYIVTNILLRDLVMDYVDNAY